MCDETGIEFESAYSLFMGGGPLDHCYIQVEKDADEIEEVALCTNGRKLEVYVYLRDDEDDHLFVLYEIEEHVVH